MTDTTHVNSQANGVPQFLVLQVLSALISGSHNEMIADYRARLMDALGELGSDDTVEFRNLMQWGLEFLRLNNRHPETVGAIREWFGNNESLGGPSGARDYIRESLDSELESWDSPDWQEHKVFEDLEAIIQVLLETGRQRYHAYYHKIAAKMASGVRPAATDSRDSDEKDLVGMALPDQARIYLNRKIAKDPFVGIGDKGLQGDITENLIAVSEGLDDKLRPQPGQRLLTGIKEIDSNMVIGPVGLRWIGILGYTGSGKSTMLKSMLLAFVRQGAHILFVPREESAETAMDHLIWCNAFDSKIPNLPSLQKWLCAPEAITPENQMAKELAITAWKALSGSIEVIEKESLVEIMEFYETHKKRRQFTVLAIDYVAHLKSEKQGRDNEQDPHKRDFEALQALSLRDKLVIISPLQANRTGFEAAKSGDEGYEGVYRDCNAVEWYSAASQGMDVVLGCFYHGELKQANTMRLSCPKPPRSGIGFNSVDVYVDSTTRRIRPVKLAEQHATESRENDEMLRKQAERARRSGRGHNT